MTKRPDDVQARLASLPEEDISMLLQQTMRRAADEGLVDVAYTSVDSPIGTLTLAATDRGLVRLGFPTEDAVLDSIAVSVSPRIVEMPARLDAVRRQLDEYFEGRRHDFDVPLDWQMSRGFRRAVLERLYAEVEFGRVVTYRDLAVAVGNPKASRAVGTAMATNPIPIIVPCHRVLRTGGALGGYGGGVPVKEYLLRHEGALL